jgi:hypothetical protein
MGLEIFVAVIVDVIFDFKIFEDFCNRFGYETLFSVTRDYFHCRRGRRGQRCRSVFLFFDGCDHHRRRLCTPIDAKQHPNLDAFAIQYLAID